MCQSYLPTFLPTGYGAHIDDYPTAYMTAACAIGIRREEIDEFISRLDKALHHYKKRKRGVITNITSTSSAQEGADGEIAT